jgi:hypothetical protein
MLRRKPEPSHFDLTFTGGQKSYFLTGGPRGVVAGLRVPGKDDHLTVGTDGDEIMQVHRKINGREDWRLTSESLQAEADSFLANNTVLIEPSSISPDSYIVSLDRVNIIFSALQSILSIPLPLLIRLISTRRFRRTEKGVEGWIVIEPNRIRHLVRSARFPTTIISPILRQVFPKLLPPLIRRMTRHVLIPIHEIQNIGDDTALIISNDRIGIVWQDENYDLRLIPLTAIFEVIQRIEKNQPFGRLDELATPDIGAIRLSAKSWL